MSDFWLDVQRTIRELLIPAKQVQPDDTTPEAIARWVESHRWPKEGQ